MERTFITNRSGILRQILIDIGFSEGFPDENNIYNVYFSYWDRFQESKNINSIIDVIPRNITNKIDVKSRFYLYLKNKNLEKFMPLTYLDLKNLNKEIFNNNKNYFLKNIYSSSGRNVHMIRRYDELTKIVNNKYNDYILQEEVPNIYLYDGYKGTMRSWVLITTNPYKQYIFVESVIDINNYLYDKNNLDNKIHNGIYGHTYPFRFSKQNYYLEVLHKLINKLQKINLLYEETKDIKEKQFILCGCDFIINNDYEPYFIEINHYPDLEIEIENYPMKKFFLKDMINLLMTNGINEGGFININEEENIDNDYIRKKLNFFECNDRTKHTREMHKYLDNTLKPLNMYKDISNIIINKLGAKSVLDVGCFTGNLLLELNNLNYYCGIELSFFFGKKAEEIARKKNFDAKIYYGDCEGDASNLFPESNQYDVIYFGGILPYLISWDKIYATIYGYDIEMISLQNILKAYLIKYSPNYIIIQEPRKWRIDYEKIYNQFLSKLLKYLPEISFTKKYDDIDDNLFNNVDVSSRDIFVYKVLYK